MYTRDIRAPQDLQAIMDELDSEFLRTTVHNPLRHARAHITGFPRPIPPSAWQPGTIILTPIQIRHARQPTEDLLVHDLYIVWDARGLDLTRQESLYRQRRVYGSLATSRSHHTPAGDSSVTLYAPPHPGIERIIELRQTLEDGPYKRALIHPGYPQRIGRMRRLPTLEKLYRQSRRTADSLHQAREWERLASGAIEDLHARLAKSLRSVYTPHGREMREELMGQAYLDLIVGA